MLPVVSMRIRSHGYSSDTLPDIPDLSGRTSCGQPPEFPPLACTVSVVFVRSLPPSKLRDFYLLLLYLLHPYFTRVVDNLCVVYTTPMPEMVK